MKHSSTTTRFLLLFENPLFTSIFAFVIYLILATSNGSPFRVTETAYFNYLADSFLHGQLHLRLLPASLHDLSFFNEKYYLYWPPMPAIVLMPLVAIFGVSFSDVFFTIIVASINVGCVALLLRAAKDETLIESDAVTRALLVIFFAFGTVQLPLAPMGQIWFTSQEVSFFFVALAYLVALRWNGGRAFFLTGLLIACASLTRNHLLFAGIWPLWHLLKKNWGLPPHPYVSLVLFALPLLLLGSSFLAYNFIRFGNPLESGIQYHQMHRLYVEDFQKYSTFNLHYLPINFFYEYVSYPFPFTKESLRGGSLFLLSPVYFFLFPSLVYRYRSADTWVLFLSVLATSIPIMLFMGTGWMQFGPRYSFDFTVPLLLLTAQGLQFVLKRILALLVLIAIIQYFIGTLILMYILK